MVPICNVARCYRQPIELLNQLAETCGWQREADRWLAPRGFGGVRDRGTRMADNKTVNRRVTVACRIVGAELERPRLVIEIPKGVDIGGVVIGQQAWIEFNVEEQQ